MVEKVTIARPYAKAAFDYAREQNEFARWSHLLATGAAVVSDDRVAKLLTSPSVSAAQLIGLIAEFIGEGLDDKGRNFLMTLASNRRLGVLPQVSNLFEMLRAEVENIADVQVTSAVPLADGQRERLTNALKKRLKREVRLHCEVDASLIGGAIVRSGDLVIDGSLKARLARLSSELSH